MKKTLSALLFIILWLPLFPINKDLATPPPDDKAVEVSVTLFINRIFNVNTVDESYQVDAYLFFKWKDERLKQLHLKDAKEPLVFENENADDLIKNKIWFPTFELINIQGTQQTHNKGIVIEPDGSIIFDQRFCGTFSSSMNYKQFPFDSQSFKVLIESYSYNNCQLIFTEPVLLPELDEQEFLLDKWVIKSIDARVEPISYDRLPDFVEPTSVFDRVVFEIKAKRLSGYYVWQVLFPLIIIILASFVIFWIDDFSTQIAIGFTLMLTVVAFNFYSASILPKLPYNTFIESIIMVGYLFIFLGIIAVITNNRLYPQKKVIGTSRLLIVFRYLFPSFFALSILWLYLRFFK